MNKVTIKEVAKRAGVSVATVSRALNPATQKLVKPQTVRKIKEVARALNYLPHRAASSLRKKQTQTIGLLNFGHSIFSGYVSEIVKGIFTGLEEIGYDLKLISGQEFYSLGAILDNAGVDGIITTHAYKKAFPNLENEIANQKGKTFPVIVVNDFNPKWKINQIYVDSYKASTKLIEHLLKRGFRNFYLIGGEPESNDAQARKIAFLKIIKKHKIPFSEERIYNGHFSEEGGYTCAKQILNKDRKFRGVFYCLNDAMAIGALRAIGEFKLRCPEDIKVVGFDGIPETEFTNPPLTTMKFPLFEMGYYASQLIYKIIQGKIKRPIKKEFQAELVIRKSC